MDSMRSGGREEVLVFRRARNMVRFEKMPRFSWANRRLECCEILAFWESLDSYQSFMCGKHDEFFERSRQKGTYHKIAVDIVEVKQRNEFNHMSITEVLQKRKMLHVVYSDRIKEKAWSF
ncbi:DUF4937 domain-containing protein [Parageobacillus toebii]|nr:DUF4937 domain-containing protein [Parageobacillus toebii]MED4988621.1 DUF4937 domain-containing protein [Parageobacillus toebii]